MADLARPLLAAALLPLALAGCNLAVATGQIAAWEGDPSGLSTGGTADPGTGGAATGATGSRATTLPIGEGEGGGAVTQPPPPPSGPGAYHAEFRLRVRPSAGVVTVEAASSSVAPAGDFAAAIAAPAGTFVMTAAALGADEQCPEGAQSSSLCFDVSLRHTLPRSLANVFVEVLEVLPASGAGEAPATGPLNPDPAELGLDASKGLWKYTSPAVAAAGVLGASPYQSAGRRWAISTEEHGDVDLLVQVVASLGYSTYAEDFSDQAFVDACAQGVDLGQPPSVVQALPFPFSLYGVTLSSVFLDARGVLSLGESAPVVGASGLTLPSASAPRASVFAFWDDLTYGEGGALCALEAGEAPNRRLYVTWRGMDFAAPADAGASLTFTAVLAEGSNRVDLVYDQMSGPTARASGTSAVFGVQNEAGTAATAEAFYGGLTAGAAYSFLPLP